MSPAGLIVAGGAGERMRRSGGRVPKPLVEIGGTTLLEHNLRAMLSAGIHDIHVAVSAGSPDVVEFVSTHGAEIVSRSGGHLDLILEDPPLGSMGAAALVEDPGDLVVANADNLTALRLDEVWDAHRVSGAAMTVAVHDEPFAMPFGEITLDGDRVVAYREKPTYFVTVCSAVSVLGPHARKLIERGEAVGLPVVANRVLEHGLLVHGHVHDAPWIDVNDLGAAARAEELLDEHRDLFSGSAP